MATIRQQEVLEQLIPKLQRLGDIGAESLVQQDRLGSELSFASATEMFAEVIALAHRLSRAGLEHVPYAVLAQVQSAVDQLIQLIGQVLQFQPTSGSDGRNSLIQQIEDQWQSLYTVSSPILAAEGAKAVGEVTDKAAKLDSVLAASYEAADHLRAKQEEVSSRLDEFTQSKAAEFQKAGEARLIEVDAVLKSVRDVAAEAGVSQHAKYFDQEASAFKHQSKLWLIALVSAALLLLVYALAGGALLDRFRLSPASTQQTILDGVRLLSQRALVAFVLVFAVIWTARNYSAARHNEVVNLHRRNSLGSFETFVRSASDAATKNAVLMQATQSIFAPSKPGT